MALAFSLLLIVIVASIQEISAQLCSRVSIDQFGSVCEDEPGLCTIFLNDTVHRNCAELCGQAGLSCLGQSNDSTVSCTEYQKRSAGLESICDESESSSARLCSCGIIQAPFIPISTASPTTSSLNDSSPSPTSTILNNSGSCEEPTPLCMLCLCLPESAGKAAKIICTDTNPVSLPTNNVSAYISGNRLEMMLTRAVVVGGELNPSHVQPWTADFILTTMVLDDNGLTSITAGAFSTATNLRLLTISRQPQLEVTITMLGLPQSIVSLTLRQLLLNTSAPLFTDHHNQQNIIDLPNLTSLALTDVGLEGALDVPSCIFGTACQLHRLSLADNNLTLVNARGCSQFEYLDISNNSELDCQASLPWPTDKWPNVQGNKYCSVPNANCSFSSADVATVSRMWATKSCEVFLTAGHDINDAPTWIDFTSSVAELVNIGADDDNVVSAAVINTSCPAVTFAYNVSVDGQAVFGVPGIVFDTNTLRAHGSVAIITSTASGDITYTVTVALMNGNGERFDIGEFNLVVSNHMGCRAMENAVAYINTEAEVPPIAECTGGRSLRYAVRNGTSLPPGLVLDEKFGFLRGSITVNDLGNDCYLTDMLKAVANRSLSRMEWPVSLDCVDMNGAMFPLGTTAVVVKPPFEFDCPTASVNINRFSTNVIQSTQLFGNKTNAHWFTTVQSSSGFSLPPEVQLDPDLGTIYGHTNSPGVFTFLVRVSGADGVSTLCPTTIRVHENSGDSECPHDAEYHDNTNNPFDGVFLCKCTNVEASWAVDESTWQMRKLCPKMIENDDDAASSTSKDDRTYLLGGICGGAIFIIAFALILYRYRHRRSDIGGTTLWKCKTPAAELEMRPQDMTVLKRLGSGQFGVVDIVKVCSSSPHSHKHLSRKLTPKTGLFARKQCSGCHLTNLDRDNFVSEIEIAIKMNHKNVLKTVGIITQHGADHLCMLSELCSGGDLHKYLRTMQPNNLGTGISLINMLQFCLDISEGLEYFSNKGFVHRDIACRNCFLSKPDLTVKIGDFGLSRRLSERDYYRKCSDGLVPVRWMAPECLQKGVCTIHSDVWSVGIVFWEIFTYGDIPYPTMSNRGVLKEILEGYRLPEPPLMRATSTSPEYGLYQVCQRCWELDPSARPSGASIVYILRSMLERSRICGSDNAQNAQVQVLTETMRSSLRPSLCESIYEYDDVIDLSLSANNSTISCTGTSSNKRQMNSIAVTKLSSAKTEENGCSKQRADRTMQSVDSGVSSVISGRGDNRGHYGKTMKSSHNTNLAGKSASQNSLLSMGSGNHLSSVESGVVQPFNTTSFKADAIYKIVASDNGPVLYEITRDQKGITADTLRGKLNSVAAKSKDEQVYIPADAMVSSPGLDRSIYPDFDAGTDHDCYHSSSESKASTPDSLNVGVFQSTDIDFASQKSRLALTCATSQLYDTMVDPLVGRSTSPADITNDSARTPRSSNAIDVKDLHSSSRKLDLTRIEAASEIHPNHILTLTLDSDFAEPTTANEVAV